MFENQLRSILQWENPDPDFFFEKFTENGDEIKNASKLIVGPGQGCLFVLEGEVSAIYEDEGMFDLHTGNVPFFTTIRSALALRAGSESKHKTALWFFRKGELVNIRWGTRSPIKYNDPIYTFPVGLRAFGNVSVSVTDMYRFFANIAAGQDVFTIQDLQEIFLSRITQPIQDYLANAKFSYAEIDSNLNDIAKAGLENTHDVFSDLGFRLTDFRIEGTSFDEDTQARIGRIADVNADVQAAKLAGLDYSEMEKLKALREAAKNESGAAGAGIGLGAGIQLGETMSSTSKQEDKADPMERLKKLKQMFEMELISEEEYNSKKQEILKDM